MLAQRAVIATNRFGPRKRLRWFACAQAQPGMAQQAPDAQAARRLLKSTIRVIDLDASVQWYTKNFGVKLLSQDGSKAQLGFGPSAAGFFTLELQGQAHGSEPIDLGEGFGHFGLAVADVYETVQHVKDNGGKVTRNAGAVKGGTTVIAFVEDPTGYKWELIGRPADSIKDPMCQVMLRVMDLQRSIKFYTEVLGLDLIRTRENPQYKYTLAFLGYGAEQDVPVFELTYNWDREMPYAKGVNPGYAYTVVHTKDVSQLAAQAEAAGAGTVQAPADLPGAVALTEPDGWMVVLTDSA